MKILAVYGSTHQEGIARTMAQLIGAAAEAQGAKVQYADLLQQPLPPFRTDQDFSQTPEVAKIRQACAEADAFIVVSPEYHGCMSNWIKNFFDFHYHEFAGKLFAIAASTGGSLGVSCNTQMRVAIQHCHGWVLPYQTAVRTSDLENGEISSPKILERLAFMGRDLVVYGQLLENQFGADRQQVKQIPEQRKSNGFAGWYA